MAQTNPNQRMSLSLLAKNWAECKEQSGDCSAQSSALMSALESVSTGALSSSQALSMIAVFGQRNR